MTANLPEDTDKRLEILEAALDTTQTANVALREQLQWNAMLAAEDVGWRKIFGGIEEAEGPTFDQLKEWSIKLREALGNVHIGRGLKLRTNNIWAGNIHYSDLPSGSGKRKQTKKYVDDPLNQINFFGPQAHNERESALYTDSMYLVLGDPSDYSLEPIPMASVGSLTMNPKRADEIIAYRVDYMDYSKDKKGEARRDWHYTDLGYARRNKAGFQIILENGETAPDDRVIFDLHVNTQVGWIFGVPDSMAAYAWAKIYRDFIMNGKVMSDAMAQFAFQVATGTKKETQNVAARIAEPSDAGATLVGANSLVPLPTAGKGYDFDSGRALLAIVAAALEVSVIGLSSDPGTAGSSYGSASTLDLPTRLAMMSRRELHIAFDRRVLMWMGADPDVDITFSPLDDSAESYRKLQALMLALNSGLFNGEPIEEAMSEILSIVGNEIPADWISPNAVKVQAQKTAQASAKATADGPKQTAAPEQGKASGVGRGTKNGQDIRNDKVSK